MADNVTITEGAGTTIAADEIASVKYQRVKVTWGADGTANDASAANPLPVVQTGTPGLPTGAASEATLAAIQTLIDALTTPSDTQPISAASLPLPSGASTSAKQDALAALVGEVQASPTSNTVLDRLKTLATLLGGTLTVSLPSGASTAANQSTGNASLSSIDGKIPALGQALAAASTPVVLPAAQITTLTPPAAITNYATETTLDARTGSLTETAPATDTASSGINGRLQRIAQRLTTLLAVFPTTIDTNSGNKSASTLRVVLATDQPTMTNAQPVTGQVGGYTLTPTATPTISTSAYASGDQLGGKITLTNAARSSIGSGTIQHVTISDLAKQSAPIDVLFFTTDPSNTTFTDNAATDIHDTDILTLVGAVSVNSWFALNDNSVGCAVAGIPFKLSTGTSLYAALVVRGTPTYASTSDITLTVGILAD